MGRVLAISSQTVYGPVGNSAAVPALQQSGHEVMALPTVVLSNHPGHGKPAGLATQVPLILDVFSSLERLGAFTGLDAVLAGYFASAQQVIAVAKQIDTLKAENHRLHVLVDPVIGDHGTLYVGTEVAEAIRDLLLPLATIITPNLFELGWLSGERDIEAGVRKLHVPETIVTSVPDGQNLVTQLYADGDIGKHRMPRRDGVPNGTGDFLAGCYLAERLGAPASGAFAAAMVRLEAAVVRSAGSVVLR